MTHTYFFQYNVPAENTRNNKTDEFVNIFCQWNDENFYLDGRPMVANKVPVIQHLYDLVNVKDWSLVYDEVTKIAEYHFSKIAERIKVQRAKEVLSNAKVIGDFTVAPTLERYTLPPEMGNEMNTSFGETYQSQLTDLS